MSEFPHELIRQVQIRTRAAAGLPDYDPNDPTLPALPSVAATIATLDPSPPHLRCKNCKGRLLNGSQSIICVYCGSRPQNDVVPDPISFNSTVGYHWLLRSLRLDGSELVKPPTSKTEKDQGRSSSKAEIRLSDFLNFKIAWPAETEESKRSLGFTEVAPDNFFFKSKMENASDISIRQPTMQTRDWAAGTKEAATLDSQYRDHDIQSSEAAASSSKPNSSEAFSAWEADFQSADSQNLPSVSKSSHHFTGSASESGEKLHSSQSFDSQNSSSLFTHHFSASSAESGNKIQDSQSFDHATDLDLDSVFGTGKDTDESINNPTAPSAVIQWDSDDLWKNLSSNESKHVGRLSEDNGASAHNQDDLSTSPDLFQDFQWKPNNTSIAENTTPREANKTIDEDSFDDWNDFAGSNNMQDSSVATDKVHNKEDEDSFNEWNDFTGSNNLQDTSVVTDEVHKKEDEDSFNEWNDFTGSNNLQDTSMVMGEVHKKADEDSFNQWNLQDPSVTTDEAHKVVDEDSFDEWNDFTGSPNLQDPSGSASFGSNFQLSISHEKSSEIDLSSPNSGFGGDFSNFPERNLISTPASNSNYPTDATLSENPVSDSVDLFQDFQLQPNNTSVTQNTTSDEANKTIDEDSFDDWNDFTGSNNLQGPSVTTDVPQNPASNSVDLFQDFQSRPSNTSITENTSVEENKTVDKDSFDDWNDFTGPNNLQNPSVEGKVQNPTSNSADLFQDYHSQPNNTSITENGRSDEENKRVDEDSFDVWNDFTGSNNLQDPSVTAEEAHITADEDAFDDWNDFTSSNNPQNSSVTTDEPHKMGDEDSFNEWNDFTASPNMQDPSATGSAWFGSNYELSTSHKKPSETELTSHNSGFEGDFNVFPERDLNSTSTSNNNFPTDATSPENPASNSFDFFLDFQWKPNTTRITENTMTDGANKTSNEDSFDDWNDFTGSTNQQDPSGGAEKVLKTANEDSFGEWNDFTGSPILQEPSGSDLLGSNTQLSTSDKKSSDMDLFSPNSGFEGAFHIFPETDVSTSTSNTNLPTDAILSESSAFNSVDLFQDFHWQPNNTCMTENTTKDEAHKTVDEDSSDEWNDFTGSSNLQDSSGTTDKGHKTADEDSFDEWNDFTGSSNMQDPSGSSSFENNYQLSTSHRKPLDIGLFSSNSGFEGGLDIFPERSLVSTSTSNSNFLKDATWSDNSSLNGLIGASKPPTESTMAKNDVMMLLSQMHDLSFTLEKDSNTRSSSHSH